MKRMTKILPLVLTTGIQRLGNGRVPIFTGVQKEVAGCVYVCVCKEGSEQAVTGAPASQTTVQIAK